MLMSIIWITDHLAGLFNIKSVNQNTILEKENNFLKNEIFIYPQEIALTTDTTKSVTGRSSLFPFEDGFLDDSHGDQSLSSGLSSPTRCQNGERVERYSRKVFVGGLPPDIDEGTVNKLHW